MRAEVCGACKFWQQRDEQAEMGECRRSPPTLQLVTLRAPLSNEVQARPLAAFPPTHATSWCGEWADDFKRGDE